jgi:pimeloyl-ACP methyl ester carboxylesterase
MIDDAAEQRYREHLPAVEVAMLPKAGHDLWSRDPDAFYDVVAPFLAGVDAGG